MKLQKIIYILIYSILLNNTYQKLEEEIKRFENINFQQNESFKIIIKYTNGKYYVPMSTEEAVNINIESKNDDLNDYYFKYFYVTEDETKIISNEDIYYQSPNITMIIPESRYIVVELKNKNNNNKIYLKSEPIIYNKNFQQYNEIFDDYFDKVKNLFSDNHFSLIIFFSTFCFITTASAIFICVDLKGDKKFSFSNLSPKNITRKEYKKLKYSYINRNIFLFAFFIMKYIYPFTNIFTMYKYDFPRYIRLFILLNKILLNILICSFYYYYFITINSYYIFIIIFLCSLITSFVLYIITQLLTLFLNYNQKRKEIWKFIFENFRKYIYYNVKKDIIFTSKWNLIKIRIITYTRICGNSLLKRKPVDKYKTYANYKKKCNQTLPIDITSNNNNSILKSQNSDEKEIFTDNHISNTLNIKQNNININNFLVKNDSVKRRKRTFFPIMNEVIPNGLFCIDKNIESFTLSKLGQNNLKLKTVQRFEDIRNRYIFINDAKCRSTMAVNSFDKIYENLQIETLENYTYISTDSMNSQLHITSSESQKILNNTIATLFLFLLLALIDIGLINIYNNETDENKKNNYLFFCIFPVILQIIVFNFAVNYLYSFFISFLIFKGYGYNKTNCFCKMIFKLFVEKYIKYIYRVRLIINKYHRELDFINK